VNPSVDDFRLSAAVERFRQQLGVTQAEMAERIDTVQSQYSKKVHCSVGWTVDDLRRLYALGMPADSLLGAGPRR
jgi:hypothetical protein